MSFHRTSPTMTTRSGRSHTILGSKVDLRGVIYVDEIDENLMCPICRCGLIDPVTTDCDHTFCQWCIDEALSHQEVCPVDRLPLSSINYFKSPKILYNQLDNLKTQCPCCLARFPRSFLQGHLDKQCPEAMITCPGFADPERSCKQTIKRKNVDDGCPHYETSCPDCLDVLLYAELEKHQATECVEKHIQCDRCEQDIIRCQRDEHEETCINKIIACKWAEFGCSYQDKRCLQPDHLNSCAYKIVGPMAELFKQQINTLQSEIRTLNEKNELQERRIKFLEKGSHLSDQQADQQLASYADLSSAPFPHLPSTMLNSDQQMEPAQEYFLSLLEGQEHRVNRLATDLTDLDSKQTVMLFNETMPIKNEMAELRSNLQVTSTHVRFLMRLRLQENQQRRFGGWGVGAATVNASGNAASNPAGGAGGSGNASPIVQAVSESSLPLQGRRLSDTTRDNLTRL